MHIIRLRHPWQAAWRDQPSDALLAPIRSHTSHIFRAAHYSRQFHRPSGLREQQPVTLILQPTAGVSLVMQPNESRPQSTLTTPTTAAATDTSLGCVETTCTIAIHSILLNSRPLSLSAATSPAQLITNISARIDSLLEPFNQLEILCSIAASETIDNATAAVQSAAACGVSPPTLPQWAEMRLEIDD